MIWSVCTCDGDVWAVYVYPWVVGYQEVITDVRLDNTSPGISSSHLELRVVPRFLDMIIRKDKTLVCTFEDNSKQNGVNSGQLLTAIRVRTWPKYNKHHHDLKNQLCRLIDMYIRKIFGRRHHVEDAQKKRFGDRVGSCSVRFLTPLCLNPFTVRCIKLSGY